MGWFDQSPAGNLGIYGGGVAPSAPVQAPVQPQIDINYVAKKRIADALRQKAVDAAKRPGTDFSDTIVSDGVNGAPGQVQVNYGGILANALTPWLNQRGADQATEEADTAEDEATAARMEALNRLTGKETPQELIALGEQTGMQELTNAGITQMTKPPKDYTAQMLQYGGTSAGMRSINAVLPGTYTDEQIATQANAEETERKRVQQEKIAVKQAGVAPRAPDSKAQVLGGMYAKFAAMPDGPEKKAYGDQIRQMELMDDAPKTGGGGVTFNPETGELEMSGGPGGWSTGQLKDFTKQSTELYGLQQKYKNMSKSLDRTIGKLGDAFTPQDRAAAIAQNNGYTSIANLLRSDAGQALSAQRIASAIVDARALAPVSNTDFQSLLDQYQSVLDTPEGAAEFFDALQAKVDAEAGQYGTDALYYHKQGANRMSTDIDLGTFREIMSTPPESPAMLSKEALADWEEVRKNWGSFTENQRYDALVEAGAFKRYK